MTMTQAKRKNKEIGHYWFSKDTMSFFNSEIESDIIESEGCFYFVSSERYNIDAPKKYTVREVKESGQVGTAEHSEFQQFDSVESAINWIEG